MPTKKKSPSKKTERPTGIQVEPQPDPDFSGLVDAFVKKDTETVDRIIHDKVVDIVRDRLKSH